jgi:hypothetical protein
MLLKAIMGIKIKLTRIEGKGKFGQEIKAEGQMGCIRGFEAMGTHGGCEMVPQIAGWMRKDKARVETPQKELGRAQGLKVKGPFGWCYTAVDGDAMEKRLVWVVWIAAIVLGVLFVLFRSA